MSSLEFDRRIEAKGSGATVVSLLPARANVPTSVSSVLSAERPSADAAAIRLTDVHIHGGSTTGFDVHLVRKGTSSQNLNRANATFLGSISLFNHEAAEHGAAHKINQVFYVTKAMRALNATSLAALDIVFIPYELATPPKMAHPKLSLGSHVDGGVACRLRFGPAPIADRPLVSRGGGLNGLFCVLTGVLLLFPVRLTLGSPLMAPTSHTPHEAEANVGSASA